MGILKDLYFSRIQHHYKVGHSLCSATSCATSGGSCVLALSTKTSS